MNRSNHIKPDPAIVESHLMMILSSNSSSCISPPAVHPGIRTHEALERIAGTYVTYVGRETWGNVGWCAAGECVSEELVLPCFLQLFLVYVFIPVLLSLRGKHLPR